MMPSLLLTLLLQGFLPLFDTGPNDYVGLSFVNSADSAATVDVVATDGDTGRVSRGQLVLSAGEQRALLLDDILDGGETPDSGWIRVGSPGSVVDVVLAQGDPDRLAVAKPLSAATSVILPDVRVDTGFRELGHTDTLVTVARPGGFLPARLTLELFGMDGSLAGRRSMALPANKTIAFRVSDTFRDALPDNGAGGRSFQGYLRLSSGAGIVAWQRIETPLFAHVLEAAADPNPSGEVLAPFFVFGGGYRSTLNLLNPTDQSMTVQLVAEDGSGNIVGEAVTRTLGPGEGIRSDIQTLFGVVTIAVYPPPLIDGILRIGGAHNAAVSLVGNVEIGSIGQGGWIQSAMNYPLGPVSPGPWVVPLALGGDSYYSGVAIATPHESPAVQTGVTIERVLPDGTVLDVQDVSLSSGRQHTWVVGTSFEAGYVRIRSNRPVRIMSALGTRDFRLLEQVPVLER